MLLCALRIGLLKGYNEYRIIVFLSILTRLDYNSYYNVKTVFFLFFCTYRSLRNLFIPRSRGYVMSFFAASAFQLNRSGILQARTPRTHKSKHYTLWGRTYTPLFSEFTKLSQYSPTSIFFVTIIRSDPGFPSSATIFVDYILFLFYLHKSLSDTNSQVGFCKL